MLLVPGFAENTNPGNKSQVSGALLLPQFTFNHNPGNGNLEEVSSINLYKEKMWETGDLFTYFKDWKILAVNETIF